MWTALPVDNSLQKNRIELNVSRIFKPNLSYFLVSACGMSPFLSLEDFWPGLAVWWQVARPGTGLWPRDLQQPPLSRGHIQGYPGQTLETAGEIPSPISGIKEHYVPLSGHLPRWYRPRWGPALQVGGYHTTCWPGQTRISDSVFSVQGNVTLWHSNVLTSAVVRSWPPISTISSVLARGALTSAAIWKIIQSVKYRV